MALVVRGYKTELDLNNEQRTACLKHAGCARFAYNWGLARSQEVYRATGKRPNALQLHRALNALKKTDFPWMYEVSKCAPQEALRDLDRAFAHFFRRLELRKQGKLTGKLGFPRFRKKSRGIGSFRLTGHIHVFEDRIQLPRLGRLRLKECGYLPAGAKVLSATVSEEAGRWYVSVLVEEDQEAVPCTARTAVGVDLGVNRLATLSDGTTFQNPRPLKQAQKRLRRLEREKARRLIGSKNRKKTVRKLAKQHVRVARIRRDATHKLTTHLCKNHALVAIEDLHVTGMLKNHRLAQALADSNFGEIRRQLEDKAKRYGTWLVVIDRFFPSSKRCAACGYIKPALGLHERTFVCEACGVVLDRDQNAALNVLQEALRTTGSSSGSHACGQGSSGRLTGGGEPALAEAGTSHCLGSVLDG
ncbi:RNA-guided endonuclease InsQ/TnpB family protein [Thermogemmatispora tikiterensis]|uniref:RNA-guided endonuclease InsQ/TnpB family protein n=1 Tax=Thermogemmatispora tikiterensis TaxID=1825093 RepID=UPI001CB9716C|nr:RNA-guided endonuclease TnpB family protein [Thermogemmatispora tikiterensis]